MRRFVTTKSKYSTDPSLVLNLPLYETGLKANIFASYDIYAHKCSVTGATWGLQGRTFDGTDDKISIPHNDLFNGDGTEFTVLVWAKYLALPTSWWIAALIAHDKAVTPAKKWILSHTTATLLHLNNNGDINVELLSTAWTPTLGQWYQIGYTKNGSTFTFFKNGDTNGTATQAGSGWGYNTPLVIGWGEAVGETHNGVIGEALVYGARALSALEVQQTYLATKRRYGV